MIRGRGTTRDVASRFERFDRVAEYEDGESPPEGQLPTEVIEETARSIISSNTSPDVPFTRSINPYAGCEHGCIYCFARPSHSYRDLSPGLDFETKIIAKINAVPLLEAALAKPSYRPETIALGANTDPYQPVETKLKITRGVLEVLAACRHPTAIITKSAGVLRDLDLLRMLASHRAIHVAVSITTLDHRLARTMEPRASTPQRRLDTVRALAEAGIPVAVLASPMIPAINDHELERILAAAAEAGATSAGTILIRLPWEIKDLFASWLETHFPDRKDRVLNQIRAMRGGELYQSSFATRMRGEGPLADLIRQRFDLACRRYGLVTRDWALNDRDFRPPAGRQGDLFFG